MKQAIYLENAINNTSYLVKSYPYPLPGQTTVPKSYYDKIAAISSTYNLPETEYKRILKQQNNKYCICDISFNELPEREICIDHNHDNKAVRGILCHACNSALGYAKDNYQILFSAIKYLQGDTHEL
jgi:hypothetical protein